MFRNTLLACLAVLPIGLAGIASPALAHDGAHIMSAYAGHGGHHRDHHDGWWYGGIYDNDDYGYVGVPYGRLSCGEAGRIVRMNGYGDVATLRCGGGIDSFQAVRNGRVFIVDVDPRNGQMWQG